MVRVYAGLCAIVFLAVAPLAACRPGSGVDRRVALAWKHHEQVLATAIEGRQNHDEFLNTCAFFEELTGIQLHLDFFTLGARPTPESRNDLKNLQAWYRTNQEALYWDEATGKVKMRPTNAMGRAGRPRSPPPSAAPPAKSSPQGDDSNNIR
jgi:hypothetical protein